MEEDNNKLVQKQVSISAKALENFNVILSKLSIVCFGIGVTAVYQFFYYANYASAIFDVLVFLWLLNTIRKVNFLKETA
jgi:hypothetical protein